MKTQRVSIMTSGGLDSYIAYYYELSLGFIPLPIFVNLGQPYYEKELEAIKRFKYFDTIRFVDAVIMKKEWGNTPTVNNWIIPARNLFLVTIGAMYSGRVWLQALDGETHKFARERDKTPEFFHLSSGLLTYVCDIERPETIVETPFGELTKTEVVEWALSNGISEGELLLTTSCYHESERNCGQCGTCFKRWIAMINNGIGEEYGVEPWTNEYARNSIKATQKAMSEGDYSHYSKKRCEETMAALSKVGLA